jgi:uncharacterized protein YkuJ
VNHIGDANKMVETPRTDGAEKHAYQFKDEFTPVCESKFVRQLERELNEANAKIKRLEEAGDNFIDSACAIRDWDGEDLFGLRNFWIKAKEAKL